MHQPEVYVKGNSLQVMGSNLVLDKYLKNIQWKKEEITILDIGCADGSNTINVLLPRIPKKSINVFACDVSKKMINYAKSRNYEPEINFVVLDISGKSVPHDWHQKFDHIFSFYCLHWIADVSLVYQNIFGMLRPDGDLLISHPHNVDIHKVMLKLSKYPRWSRYYIKEEIRKAFEGNCNSKGVTENILKKIGFSKYFCKMERLTYTWENMEDFLVFVEALSPTIHCLNDDDDETSSLKKVYFDDLLTELKECQEFTFSRNKNGDEIVTMTYNVMVVYASKC